MPNDKKFRISDFGFRIWQFNKAFTLIELLVIISIIGILVTITTVNFDNFRQKGRDGARKQDLQTLKTALVLYYQDQKTFPGPAGNHSFYSANSWIVPLAPTYIERYPQDPIQTDHTTTNCSVMHIYCYILTSNGDFVLWTQLENLRDKDAQGRPDSPCDSTLTPPAPNFNYCIQSPSL